MRALEWLLSRRARRLADLDAAINRHPAGKRIPSDTEPAVAVLPGGLTCLRCEENPALPDRIWCAVCAPVIDALPAEPIERGGK